MAAPPGAKFCAECGARIDPAASPEELRKLVTILFCDLVGSTNLGERLDPEAFRRVQLRYFTVCETALHKHRGTIEKFIGDAVLCVFGIPTAREDDALRACRAGLDLLAGIDDLNLELEQQWGVRLAVRIGVNSGVVVAGETHGQTVVTGDTVNTAARLEQAAGPGEVLIGALTRELVADAATCTPIRPLDLKGKDESVAAWRLLDVDSRPYTSAVRAVELPIVGRDTELQRIESWLGAPERAASGGVCLIVGAPGVGKSRLAAAVVDRTRGLALRGRCAPYGEGIAYAPVADWLDALGDGALEQLLTPETVAPLRFALDQTDAPATTEEIHAAARSLALALTGSEPPILLVEDVHWAEASMLELLGSLGRLPGVVVIACGRPEVLDASPGLGTGNSDLLLSVAPLNFESASTLLELVDPDLAAADRVRLLQVAEGNPLVLGQLARHIAEGGDPEALPPSLDALLQARVEGLSAEERTVAERCAVMGREFWDSGVAALAPEASAPGAAIALLMGRAFVAEGRADGAANVLSPTLSRAFADTAHPYNFTSSLLRDALYQATPKLRRADLHERLAGLLEGAGAAHEPVAFHLERAARLRSELRPRDAEPLAARAAEHLELAGERALQRNDAEAARALLSRAAALVDNGSATRDRLEASLGPVERSTGVELVPGDVVGSYRVRAVAGRGGMGIVYRADDLALGRQVALKVIAPQLAGDIRFRERFVRESRIAAGLEHPNVVPVYGAGEQNGQLFIAMRFIEGTDLQSLLRSGPLAPARAAALVVQVADALDAAHARGLVHRDVKPANVLIARAGSAEQAYLTDFGLTRDAAAGDGLTKTGQWVGTLAYVAPEQIRGEPVDARADIYALGALFYQCLTGRVPFEVESELEALAAHLDEPPPRPSAAGVPRALDGVIERAMSKEPRGRYRSAGDLGRAGLAAVQGTRPRLAEKTIATGAAAPVDEGRRRRGRSRRSTVLIGVGAGTAVAALAVAVALAAGVFSGGSGGPRNPAGAVVGSPRVLPYSPDQLATADGRVWALTTDNNQLMRIDVASGKLATFPGGVDLGGGSFTDLGASTAAVWLTHDIGQFGGVDHIDASTGQAVQHVPLLRATAVDVVGGAVWALAVGSGPKLPGVVVRIDPADDEITGGRTATGRNPAALVVADGSVWVANRRDGSVWRIDPRTRAIQAKVPVGSQPSLLAASGSRVWVANLGDQTLMHIDPATNRVVGAPISLGKNIQDLAASPDAVWVAAADGTVTRLDPATGTQIGTPFSPARAPLELAVDGKTLWVASATDRTLIRIQEGRQ